AQNKRNCYLCTPKSRKRKITALFLVGLSARAVRNNLPPHNDDGRCGLRIKEKSIQFIQQSIKLKCQDY
ncbi:MAG: hypothetical protein PUH44_00180, partial [Bacteroidales bacterium]|nr:hypothetical protein [Bacteroidales bacterium]MDY2704939.1 hypothetical protein [Alloprevotella sp.]